MTTASAVSTLNVTGDTALTVNALHADVTTVDASGMVAGGQFIQTGRSSTEISTYTGSLGADTLMMLNKGDVLNGGAGSDTLDVNFTGILGGLSIDLSSTTDQIDTMDGSTNAAVQLGFLNVDASGYTGFGASITGSSGANTITGTASVDSISGGAGIDTITAGGGIDVITSGAGADVIVIPDSTDGADHDRISDFVTASDDIKALQSAHGWESTDNTVTVLLSTGTTIKAADDAADSNIMTISTNIATHTYATYVAGTSTYAELEGTAITAMGDTGAANTGATYLVVVDDATSTGLWQFISADNTIDDAVVAAEIELIGILTGVSDATTLVVGDFIFS
jgi:Ca2+-binding RTX toxin-like protein